ncbi:hypothetical protein [Endozoicomonas sp. SCSIO W0465]|uniref:hypothetical protein n=1 Tax=Endozoicomonas sp. SCSIO W0465 TaxID=2918516 RepID=UPI002076312F|nr:hypothetical protein [Endozoicomonas sp. SCSIO W0465]USE35562.1 hypothetical protein MJO57_26305 [Endozoicomonas sp. SCSIO W0465]
MMGHEVSASRPSVVNTHPQAMVIGPGDDPSSFFSVEHLTEPLTEPPESSSVDQEPDHSEIIARFTATQQHQITSCLSHPGVKTVLSKACTLLQTLEQRGIQLSMDRSVPPLPTLFAKLKRFNIVTEHQDCSRYFQKANVFFSAVSKTVNNTASLTSMLKSKSSVTQLAGMDDGDLAAIAAIPFLKQIASMCNGKGLPEKAKVDDLLTLGCLKMQWRGDDEVVMDKPLDPGLVSNISSMCNSRGLPEKSKVEAFLKLDCLKEGWPGMGEAVKDKPLDRPLVTNISSMSSGKGIPEKSKVEAFLQLDCLKMGWLGNDEAVKDKPLDRALITNISSMCNSRGLPEKAKVEAFLKLGCLKMGWQGNDEAVKDKPLDRALVTNISSMCNGKGLPEKAKVEAFLKLDCLKEGWQGIDEAVKDKPPDRALITHISSMCNGKGLPEQAKVEAFLKLGCLKQGWQGIDEAVRDMPIDRTLVTHISSMCSGKGLPEKADVEAFLKLSCLKRGWQGIDEAVKDSPLDRSMVTHISSMCSGRGLPEQAKVEAFLKLGCLKKGWQGIDEAVKDQPLDRALVTNISSICHRKGLPGKAKLEAFLKQGCLKQGWQGIDKAVKDQPFDRALVTHISSMFNSRGLPEKAEVDAFLKQRSEKKRDDEVIFIKEGITGLIALPHRINDQAPLWMAEKSVKMEVDEHRQRQTTFFSQIDIPNDRSIRKSINESIAKYQALDGEQREQYLKERMSAQKHDGSIFSELKGQEEVIARRDISQWELLGHYAGKQYHNNTYQQGARVMGATLANIDRYSFTPANDVFISAYREGNITSLINAYSTYASKEKNPPEQNVSFLRHRNQQGQWVVFIIAIKPIPANEILWIDYGEQYWQAARKPIEISDDNF